ncbi:Protein of unknown function [Bacillus cytotoxicus]
MMMA